MKAAIFSTKPYEQEYLDKFNTVASHALTYFTQSLNASTAKQAQGFDAVSVQLSDTVDAATLSQLAKAGVKLVVLRSAGFDCVTLAAARKENITVMRVPAYSPQAIAEHATALILTLNRKTYQAYNRVRVNNFSLDNLMGFNLYGKTVGVVGTGKIGAAFCAIMLGFGCTVIAYDGIESDTLKAKGVVYKSFDELLKCADIISIHCPLTPLTHHLFNKEAFSKMKDGVMLINTSRGAIINTPDAVEALKHDKIGYLGIDVYEGEKELFFKDLSHSVVQDDVLERLMSFNNVLITPHQAFFTKEAIDAIAETTITNLTDFENGKPQTANIVS
jgi:D-lactate dehydrogenase